MAYVVYGKRTVPIYNKLTGKLMGPDAKFAALSYSGVRVTKLSDAGSFAEKSDAQEWIDSKNWRPGVQLEIRKAR